MMLSQVQPFQAVAINKLAHELKSGGRSIIHMELGQPSTGAPAAAIAAAHRVLDGDGMGYWESAALKARIARHYVETYGVRIDSEQVILTCGASPALVLALTCRFGVGSRIALARPGYVAYRNVLKALHLMPVEVPCGAESRFQLSAAQLAALDPPPEGLILASPANPTGTIIARDELQAIADLCSKRYIRIISDEIYHGLSYVEPSRSMLEFDASALIINSFSKYFSMVGWRLGWLIVPPDAIGRARALMGNMFLTAPSLSQHAALAAMDCRKDLEGHKEVYRRNRALLLDALPSLGLTAIAPPDGAFYMYASVRHLTNDSLSLCTQLLTDTGVAAAPGIDFDPQDGRHFIRFSFAVSTPEVIEAVRRLEPWFARIKAAI